jgi:hypothetical protein
LKVGEFILSVFEGNPPISSFIFVSFYVMALPNSYLEVIPLIQIIAIVALLKADKNSGCPFA